MMKLATTSLILSTATFGLMLGVAQNAQAGVIASVTTDMGSPNSQGYDIVNTINGNGLLPGNLHVAAPSGDPDPEGVSWQSDTGVQKLGTITFDFIGTDPLKVTGFDFWNLSGEGNTNLRGIKDVTIESTTDGTTWTAVPGAPTSFAQGVVSLAPQGPQVVTFAPVLATGIRFNVTSNYGGARTGFSEIAFKGVPEPSASLALLVLGLAGIGLRKRA